MNTMHTTTIHDECGQRAAEVTLCGQSVVTERYDAGACVVVRGGYVLGGERVHDRVYATPEEAAVAAEAQIATETALVV